jgi:hypothetical protein
MSDRAYMTMEELVTVYPRLEAGESVIEPEDWAFCYYEDVTMLLAQRAELLAAGKKMLRELSDDGITGETARELQAAIEKAEVKS